MLDDDTYVEIIAELGHKRALAAALDEKLKRAQRKLHAGPRGLIHFVEHFWEILEPGRQFVQGWALLAMCQHLEAVTRGDITRLLINVPPGSMKSLLVNVFWPAWEWSACNKPQMRFVSFSYASHLTERDNQKFLDLLQSREFQRLYGHLFDLRDKGKSKVSNTKTGWKFASSVEGIGTGERGDRVILDDPHNVKDGESEPIRQRAVRFFREAMSNRLNDLAKSAIVVIMQRVNEADVSGEIIANSLGYVHLCIPLEFEPDRKCTTFVNKKLFWSDPRTVEGEIFWPERFDDDAVSECLLMGEFVYAGQYQQRPEPRGGGLFKRDYWELFAPPDGKLPKMSYVVASLDSAYTEKTQNDPSGFTVWGCFLDEHGNRSALPLIAWRKHLSLHGKCRPRAKGETLGQYKDDTQDRWGLIQWVSYEMERLGVHRLLIENKASGHDVANEMMRLFNDRSWKIELVDPSGLDKWARAQRIQPIFAEGLVYCPGVMQKDGTFAPTRYAKLLQDEMAVFPKGQFDDMTDSVTQCLWWLRQHNYLVMSQEYKISAIAKAKQYRSPPALYPV